MSAKCIQTLWFDANEQLPHKTFPKNYENMTFLVKLATGEVGVYEFEFTLARANGRHSPSWIVEGLNVLTDGSYWCVWNDPEEYFES